MSEYQDQTETRTIETPRRRRGYAATLREEAVEAREEGMEANDEENTVQEERPAQDTRAAMPVRNGSSVEQCMRYLTELEGILNRSRRIPVVGGGDNYLVNRDALLQRINALRSGLPGAMQTAVQYVNNYKMIEAQQQQECEIKLRTAQQQAQQTVSEANRHAEETTRQATEAANAMLADAEQRANAMVEAARQEAQRLMEDAMRKADYMVSEEEIVRRANVESNELREKTAQETASLRKNTFDYLDTVMGELDRYVSDMIESMRAERTELNNHRES